MIIDTALYLYSKYFVLALNFSLILVVDELFVEYFYQIKVEHTTLFFSYVKLKKIIYLL
jgi:hypothetical protein